MPGFSLHCVVQHTSLAHACKHTRNFCCPLPTASLQDECWPRPAVREQDREQGRDPSPTTIPTPLTASLPQSHSSSCSTKPLPQMATLESGCACRGLRKVHSRLCDRNCSRSAALQLLKVFAPPMRLKERVDLGGCVLAPPLLWHWAAFRNILLLERKGIAFQ